MNKVELLAPAGNYEKMKYAIAYGADAVYFAGEAFGMRALADNFEYDQIKKAIEEIFDVKVVKVNTINVKKKPKRYGRFSGFTARRKKAVIQLSEDSKPLEFFEGA